MLAAVSEDDMRAIVARLVELAKAGNVAAAREVFDRTLGKTQEADFLERIESLERLLESRRP
ncbi:MAG: hypothetical protein EPO68_01040 [Planctomycetota bacterium]|nr:MAG: hypothetical protein EPO68_01040 [Planctomycetota bacterium]